MPPETIRPRRLAPSRPQIETHPTKGDFDMNDSTGISSGKAATQPPTDAPAGSRQNDVTLAELEQAEGVIHENTRRLDALLSLIEVSTRSTEDLDPEDLWTLMAHAREMVSKLNAAASLSHAHAVRMAIGGAA